MVYLEYDFKISPLQPATDILIAELGELGFESFVENETGLLAYILKSEWKEDALEELFVFQNPNFENIYKITRTGPIPGPDIRTGHPGYPGRLLGCGAVLILFFELLKASRNPENQRKTLENRRITGMGRGPPCARTFMEGWGPVRHAQTVLRVHPQTYSGINQTFSGTAHVGPRAAPCAWANMRVQGRLHIRVAPGWGAATPFSE